MIQVEIQMTSFARRGAAAEDRCIIFDHKLLMHLINTIAGIKYERPTAGENYHSNGSQQFP
jgi:hypothetical protein